MSRLLEDLGRLDEIESIDPDTVVLENDRMYSHKLMHVNYTTYDVRRSQDVINFSNTHHNIMLLAGPDPNAKPTNEVEFFRYARVLDTFHANIIYTGPGSRGRQSQRMEFLWVRWYEVLEAETTGWSNNQLDRLRFPPVAQKDAFGFVNPSDVIRGCHILPRFSLGQRQGYGGGLSFSGKDSEDWVEYYMNR